MAAITRELRGKAEPLTIADIKALREVLSHAGVTLSRYEEDHQRV